MVPEVTTAERVQQLTLQGVKKFSVPSSGGVEKAVASQTGVISATLPLLQGDIITIGTFSQQSPTFIVKSMEVMTVISLMHIRRISGAQMPLKLAASLCIC